MGTWMAAAASEGTSLLAVDVGGANTRAALFDVVEGEYRLVATGTARSTAEAPFKDVSEGVRNAIADLQSVTGRDLLDTERRLVTPAQSDGSGVDAFVATISAGPALRTAIIGLLADVSVESARRLAETSYSRVMDVASLNDGRQADQRIDALLRLQPDVVLIAGGTDGGASRSVQKMLEPMGLSSYLLAPEKRPAVLFAGNQKLEREVRALLANVASVLHTSPNIRPSLETEDLEPAARELADLHLAVRRKQLGGMDVLDAWSGGHLLPTAYAEGRMMNLLGRVYAGFRGAILGVDIGASAAIIGADFGEKTVLRVYPQFSLGESLPGLLQHCRLEDMLRWSPEEVSADELQDYLFQKSLYPASLPVKAEDQVLARVVTRQALFLAMQMARRDFPRSARGPQLGLLPYFEPILASGSALTHAATPSQSLLLVLDSIQPVGIATIMIDPGGLLPMLGAAAGRNSMLPVQVLDSGALQSLGTVISASGSASEGALIARARLAYDDGGEARAEMRYGRLDLLPLRSGQTARITIQPRHGIDVGFGAGRGGTLTVSGGTVGLVFDGRGRPIALPDQGARRRQLLQTWMNALGG
jgi:MutL protein